MSQSVSKEKSMSFYATVAPYSTLLWRVIASIALIALAIIISS